MTVFTEQEFLNHTSEELQAFRIKGIRQKQREVLNYIKANFNMKNIKLEMLDSLSQKVIFSDNTEKIITYDVRENMVKLKNGGI